MLTLLTPACTSLWPDLVSPTCLLTCPLHAPRSDLINQAVLTGLPPGSFFEFRVQAENSQGVGPWSRVVAGATNAAVPSAPEQLSCTGHSSSALQVRSLLACLALARMLAA